MTSSINESARIRTDRRGLTRIVTRLAACLIAPFAFAGTAQAQFNGRGVYKITAVVSGKVLDIDSTLFGGWAPGRQLIQWDSNGGANQQFIILDDPRRPGTYLIRPRHYTAFCLDVPYRSSADGTVIQQLGCNDDPAQRFRIIPFGSHYLIQTAYAPSVFHVGNTTGNNSLDTGARIVLKSYNGSCPDQRMLFAFTPV